MQENMEDYIAEKEARERRLLIYAEKVQERMLHNSSEIIKKLVEERHRQNMTQQEISDIMGVLPSNLARFESGSRIPTLVVLEKYANALGKHIDIEIRDFKEKAKRVLEKALNIRRKLSKEEPDVYLMDVAQSANNLAILLDCPCVDAKENEIEDLFAEALEIRESLNQDYYWNWVADTYWNMARHYRHILNTEKAKTYYQKAIDLYEKNGEKNVEMTAIYEVRILRDYGKFLLGISENENIDEAKKVFEKAVKVLLMCDVSKEPYESEYIAVMGSISIITV